METEDMDTRLEAAFGPHAPVYRPLVCDSRYFWPFLLTLVAIMVAALAAYFYQLYQGLAITGMNSTVSWGLYISSFVFFIGISHAGTLISAILRASQAEWRRPVTRIAEMITAFALMTGALLPLIDLGNIWNIPNIVLHPNVESPLVWDMISIGTYLTGSLIYLWIPMIPDLAVLRDKMVYPEGGGLIQRLRVGLQKRLYSLLSMGWQGTPRQREMLEKAMFRMMVIIIPVAISVHTVIGYLFSMNLTRPGWHTSIFGPLFVAGAIYSGIAAILVTMYVLRKLLNLHRYLLDSHFIYLGLLMLAVGMVMVYFTISELLTGTYGRYSNEENELVNSKFTGPYWLLFWFLIIGGFILPVALIAHPRTRNVKGVTLAGVLVLLAMYAERLQIVVPSLALNRLPYDWGYYFPSPLEMLITVGTLAWFLFLMTLFIKFFPILGLWEMEEAGELDWAKTAESDSRGPAEAPPGSPATAVSAMLATPEE